MNDQKSSYDLEVKANVSAMVKTINNLLKYPNFYRLVCNPNDNSFFVCRHDGASFLAGPGLEYKVSLYLEGLNAGVQRNILSPMLQRILDDEVLIDINTTVDPQNSEEVPATEDQKLWALQQLIDRDPDIYYTLVETAYFNDRAEADMEAAITARENRHQSDTMGNT